MVSNFLFGGLSQVTRAMDIDSSKNNYGGIYQEAKETRLETTTKKGEPLILTLYDETRDFDVLSKYLTYKEIKYLGPMLYLQYLKKEKGQGANKDWEQEEVDLKTKKEILETEAQTIVFTIRDKNETPIGRLDASLEEGSLVNIGYWIGESFQGKGYAGAAIDVFLEKFGSKIINASDINGVCITSFSENRASIGLANKILNFLKEKNKDVYGEIETTDFKFIGCIDCCNVLGLESDNTKCSECSDLRELNLKYFVLHKR